MTALGGREVSQRRLSITVSCCPTHLVLISPHDTEARDILQDACEAVEACQCDDGCAKCSYDEF